MVMTNRNAKAGFRGGRDTAAVQENVELLTGQRGNGLDRAITIRELAQLGLINVSRNSNGSVIPRPVPPIFPDDKPVDVPHAPVGFAAFGGFGAIMLEWQNPTFSGFAHAEVWRAASNIDNSAPNLDQAVLIATTPATVFGDIVNPGSTFYYWCRFVNVNNFPGPYNDVDGVKVSTSPNISDIIDDIGNQMKESELIQGLVTDISDGDKAVQEAIDLAKKQLASADKVLQGSLDSVKEELAVADKVLQGSIDSAKEELTAANDLLTDVIANVDAGYKNGDIEAHAAIKELEQAVIIDDGILAQQLAQLDAAFKTSNESSTQTTNAKITHVQKVLVDANSALSQLITELDASYKQADNATSEVIKSVKANITEMDKVLTSTDKALAESLKALETEYKAADTILTGSISSLSQVVTTADQALAQKIEKVKSDYKGADASTNAAVTALTKTVADGDSALAERINSLSTQWQSDDAKVLISTNANIIEATKVLTSADEALAEKVSSLKTEYKAADATLLGSISSLSKVVTDADRVLAQKIDKIESDYKGADTTTNAAVTALTKTVADGDSALAERIEGLSTQWESDDAEILASANAAITESVKTLTNADKALAERVSNVESAYKSGDKTLSGAITALDKVTAERDKVVANKVNTVQSSLNGVAATVQQHSQAISTINADGSTAHKAMWSTKAQAGDIKAGIGILAKSDGTSQVAVSASQFLVFDPNVEGGSTQPLFAIDKGKVVIPKALIESATIQILNAQTIVADSVKAGISISAPTITGGKLNGAEINIGSGGNYNGHKFHVSAAGHLYAQNAVINGSGTFTGTVNASGGVFDNVTIGENCTIHGWLYANKIIGLPEGKSFGRIHRSVRPGETHRLVSVHLESSQGRFLLKSFLAGGVNAKIQGGQGTRVHVQFNVKVNNNTAYIVDCHNENDMSKFLGRTIDVGSWGGNITVDMVCHGSGYQMNFDWYDTFLYSAIFK